MEEHVIVKLVNYNGLCPRYLEITNHLTERYYEFGKEDKIEVKYSDDPIILTEDQIMLIKVIFDIYDNTIEYKNPNMKEMNITKRIRDIFRKS